MDFFEDLSTVGITCPHDNAFRPDGSTVYYRRVAAHPATSGDFLPNTRFSAPDECIAKAVSLFDNVDGLINAVFRTPAGRKKKPRKVAQVILTPACGMLKKTGSPGHHSWWRSTAFLPENCIPQNVKA